MDIYYLLECLFKFDELVRDLLTIFGEFLSSDLVRQ